MPGKYSVGILPGRQQACYSFLVFAALAIQHQQQPYCPPVSPLEQVGMYKQTADLADLSLDASVHFIATARVAALSGYAAGNLCAVAH